MSIYGEIPTGLVDGTNKVFTTAKPYFAGSTRVFLNGIRQENGGQYTESGPSTISFTAAPTSGAFLYIDYDITGGGTNYPVGEWTFDPEGYAPGSAMYYGPQLFPAGLDVGTTKTGMVVYGPGGAAANFPAVDTGLSGLSPQINFSQVQLAWNAPLPDPNPQVTVTDPGTFGTRSVINVVFYVNAGEPGPAASFAIGLADDITGALSQGINLIFDAADSVFRPQLPKVGGIYSVAFDSTAMGTTPQRSLASVNIPGQPWDWWPEVRSQTPVTNGADSRVDTVAYKGAVGSDIVGRSLGAGAGAGPVTQVMAGGFGAAMPGSVSYGKVLAGNPVAIIHRAENQVSGTSQWATGAGWLEVKVAPVP